MRRVLDWLDARSGYRSALTHLLYERLPPGTGWWFTLGSALLALLVLQFTTGAALTLYYAPTPDHAYGSVAYITRDVTFGTVVRGLHYFGASFIVIFALAHLLRVVAFGSYKKPRELTWITGVVLLLIILAFALTGYLLPWDQRAYWATVVTLRIAQSAPLVGDQLATLLRGGPDIGALTLTRWYAAHVIALPAVLVALVLSHLYLMRRHGSSGPVRERSGPAQTFYPYQMARDLAVTALLIVLLAAFVWRGMPALEPMADPSNASYVPRPEWYFLGLFQLLKYFPGRLEVIGAFVIPGLAVTLLLLLPWLDPRPERRASRRLPVLALVGAGLVALAALTYLGWRDRPPSATAQRDRWQLREIAGRKLTANAGCVRCHQDGGVADDLATQSLAHGPDWLKGHIADPDVIAPGIRPAPEPEKDPLEVEAIAAYVARLQLGPLPPPPSPEEETIGVIFGGTCIGCHTIDGDGGDEGPNLSQVGAKHDAAWLRRWITDPNVIDPDAEMPAFGDTFTPQELDAIARYLAARR